MLQRLSSLAFRLICGCVRLAYADVEVVGAENLPAEGAVVVGNHAQIYGPINAELYFPRPRVTWCAAQMMALKEVPAYAYRDFWSQKPKRVRWFYRAASFAIAPLAVCLFNNAATIPVYRDGRLRTTFRLTLERLAAGDKVVIFPEQDAPGNGIVYDFQDRFIDLARFYYKSTGRALAFVPMYSAPRLKKIVIGEPVRFDPAAPLAGERARVKRELMDGIARLARELPRHTVVPYRNIPKKDYPENLPPEEPNR